MSDQQNLAELLRWYLAAGADEAIGDAPVDRFTAVAAPLQATRKPQPTQTTVAPAAPSIAASAPSAATASARSIAAAAMDLAQLEAAVKAFDGCPLKKTATNTVFADGDPSGGLMIIGEAPGADEDRIGRPFVGRSGQLLDRMLAAIGIDRNRAYITNILYWRPPGNRKPTSEEVAICLPFVMRHIALTAPRVVVLSGGTSTSAVLGRAEGITRLRGRWFDLKVEGLEKSVPALATYHPSFLLRAPARKGEVWRDMLSLQSKLEEPL